MPTPDRTELWVAVALFIASEVIGMSKAKDNSVLQALLHAARTMFPLELKQNKTKPRKRDEHGRFM
jgi:hypothetical protein